LLGRPVQLGRFGWLSGPASGGQILGPLIAPSRRRSLDYSTTMFSSWPSPSPDDERWGTAASPRIQPASLQPAGTAEYYAGLVEDRSETPQFPKVQIGSVTWTRPGANAGGAAPSAGPVPVAKVAIGPAGIIATISLCCRPAEGATITELSLDIRLDTQPPQDPVRSLGGVEMRQTGNVQGDALVSAVSLAAPGEYRVRLSQTQADLERNMRLLLGRPWIDIPVTFASGRRAILTFTTGRIGAEIIDQALHSWH
jgi:hypothetical protein